MSDVLHDVTASILVVDDEIRSLESMARILTEEFEETLPWKEFQVDLEAVKTSWKNLGVE